MTTTQIPTAPTTEATLEDRIAKFPVDEGEAVMTRWRGTRVLTTHAANHEGSQGNPLRVLGTLQDIDAYDADRTFYVQISGDERRTLWYKDVEIVPDSGSLQSRLDALPAEVRTMQPVDHSAGVDRAAGIQVRVTDVTTDHHAALIGQQVRLLRVDRHDTTCTFLVATSADRDPRPYDAVWVKAVEYVSGLEPVEPEVGPHGIRIGDWFSWGSRNSWYRVARFEGETLMVDATFSRGRPERGVVTYEGSWGAHTLVDPEGVFDRPGGALLNEDLRALTAPPTTPNAAPGPGPEMARLQAEVERLQAQAARLQAQHEEFKRNAGETAMRYAKENDWCSEVQRCLNEIGVPLPEPDVIEFRVVHTITRTHTVRAVCTARLVDDVNEEFIKDSLRQIDGEDVTLDDDWDQDSVVTTDIEEEETSEVTTYEVISD